MVSPLVRRNLPTEGQRYPSPIHRRSLLNNNNINNIADGRQSPLGMTIVSPASSIASISHIGMPSPAKETASSHSLTQASTTVSSSRRVVNLEGTRRTSTSSAALQRSPLPPSSASSSKHIRTSTRSSHSRSGETRNPTEEEVKVLHARFNAIQMGLGSIDQERALLVDKSKKLEEEKLVVEQQLQLRDNEIIALVKRCAAQEERMREYSKLRAENRGLSNELQNNMEKLETYQSESGSLNDLRQQLNKSELAREELQKRLDWVQKEHDSIAETLSDCLENIRDVTEEKQQMEDERRRERKSAEMELEKQRLTMVQLSHSFKADMETKQHRIDRMEHILHQNNSKYESQIHDMQEELDHHDVDKARMSDILDARLTKTVEKYEQQIAEMRGQLQERDRQAAAKYEQQISITQEQLKAAEEKENTVVELRKEIENKEESVEKYEQQIAEMRGQLQERDRQAAAIYEQQISIMQEQLKAAEEEENKVVELQKDIENKEESNQRINQTVARYGDKIAELQKELDRQVEEVKNKEESNKKFNDMKKEMENMMNQIMATHETKVAKMQNQINQQVTDMESKNGRIDKKFEDMKAKLEEKGDEMTVLESEFSEQMQDLMNKQVILDKTEEQKKILEARIESLKKIESVHGALVQYTEIMESNVAELTAENGIMLVEKETLSDEKNALQEKLHGLESRVNELRDKHIAREGELKGRLDAENTQLVADIEKERDQVASAEEELHSRKSWILKIENDLSESRRLIAEKEDEMEKARTNQRQVREKLEASLLGARDEIARLEDTLEWEKTIQTQQSDASEEIESLNKALQKETKRASSSEKACMELEAELSGLIAELSERDQELEKTVELDKYYSLQAQLSDAESQVAKLEEQLQEETNTASSLADELKEFVDLRGEKEELEATNAQLEILFSTEENKAKTLEDKIDYLLSSSQDMVIELDKASSRLEEEAAEWVKKEQEWDETRITLEDENNSLEGKLTVAHEEISLVEEEMERRDRRIGSLLSEVETLNNNDNEEAFFESEQQRLLLEGQLADVRRQVKELAQNLEEKGTRIERLNDDLAKTQAALAEKDGIIESTESRCSELAGKVASLETVLSTREESLMKIDEDLDSTINEIAEKEAEIFAMKQAIAAKDAEINSAMEEMKEQKENASHLREKLSNAETKNDTYQEVLGKQTDVVSTLQKEVEITSDSKKQRTSELEKTICKMKTEIALKDDEMRDLRMVDLKDAEEEISMLQASLQSKQQIEAEVADKAAELTEKQKSIDDLMQKKFQFEQREQDMLSECETLLKSESHARELLAKREAEIESFLARERKNVEMSLRKNRESHKQEVSKLARELDATKHKVNNLESMVKERSTLLADVVDHNKELEKKMEKQHRQLSDLEEEAKEGRLELDTKRGEISKLRRDNFDKENSLKKQLKEERRNLESAEKSLEKMKRQHTDAELYKKQVAEYEKEMDVLQDKVKRQEGYMQKKLLKDRASSRSMVTPSRTSTSQSTAKTTSTRKRTSGIPGAPSTSSMSAISTPSFRRGSRTSLLRTPGGIKSPGLRNDLD
jgi:chromosome segregation ATPase